MKAAKLMAMARNRRKKARKEERLNMERMKRMNDGANGMIADGGMGNGSAGGKPINHITINTGHNIEVPRDNVNDQAMAILRPLVIGGGGVIPGTNGQYLLLLNSEDSRSCMFSIWKGTYPILICGFQEAAGKSDEMWGLLINRCKTEFDSFAQGIQKPEEPWLGVVVLPTAFFAMSDLPWLANFEQCVAETWRRLPVAQRAPISFSEEVMDLVGWKDIQARMKGQDDNGKS